MRQSVAIATCMILIAASTWRCADSSESSGKRNATTVGPEGASIDLPGGGSLVIPSGALEEEIALTVEEIPVPASDDFAAAGTFLRFGPAGTAFALPAELRLPATGGPGWRMGIAWSGDGSAWAGLPSTWDEEAGVVAGQVSHFSEGGPVSWSEASEGACCDPGGQCSVRSFAECAGNGELDGPAFLGHGIPCDLGGASVCSELTCCVDKTALNVSLTIATKDACDEESQAPLAACSQVCCTKLSTGETQVMPGAFCSDEAGAGQWLADGDPAGCTPVCCAVTDAATGDSHNVVRSKSGCESLGGQPGTEASPSAGIDDCPVCCADDFTVKPFAGCDNPASDHEQCELVCCATGPKAHAWVPDGKCEITSTRPDENCTCETDTDCGNYEGGCFMPKCVDGACTTGVAYGTACDDGDQCTSNDKCDESGECVGSGTCPTDCVTVTDCKDPDPDDCMAPDCIDGECRMVPVYGPCYDLDDCTVNDECTEEGLCVGQAYACVTPLGDPVCYELPGVCFGEDEDGEMDCDYVLTPAAQCGSSLDCPDPSWQCVMCLCIGGSASCKNVDECPPDTESFDCQVPACEQGECTTVKLGYGTVCTDGDLCTTDDQCETDGKCEGKLMDCSAPPPEEPCWTGPGECVLGACEFGHKDPGTSCGAPDACGPFICTQKGVCKHNLSACPPAKEQCKEAACIDGACGVDTAQGVECSGDAECAEATYCDLKTCSCKPAVCGDLLCHPTAGEGAMDCPQDCGCAGLKEGIFGGNKPVGCGLPAANAALFSASGCRCDDKCWFLGNCCPDFEAAGCKPGEYCAPDGSLTIYKFLSEADFPEIYATVADACKPCHADPWNSTYPCGCGLCWSLSPYNCWADVCGCARDYSPTGPNYCAEPGPPGYYQIGTTLFPAPPLTPGLCSCTFDCVATSTCCPDACDTCGYCPVCGDGLCTTGLKETCGNCPADCGECPCGNGKCEPPAEDPSTCAKDCFCGDSKCQPAGGETSATCPVDCHCGDGQCKAPYDNCMNCPADCGACS